MSYPSYSFLTPGVLEMALDLARHLRQAADDISNLTYGGSITYEASGRTGDKAVAVKDWIGPHHDTFQQMFSNELQSSLDARSRLGDEADAWAQFWATATNSRNARLYDEAVNRYSATMTVYQDRVEDYQQAVEDDPENPPVFSLPMPPPSPVRAVTVTVPSHAGNYQPTG